MCKTSLLVFFMVTVCCPALAATLEVHTKNDESIQILTFDGIKKRIFAEEKVEQGKTLKVDTLYQGLALLVFAKGQTYPFILGKKNLLLKIQDADTTPLFPKSPENMAFYNALQNSKPTPNFFEFVSLIINGKKLLESSTTIKTLKQLGSKTNEYHRFVANHYENIKHSDMVRRLIAQSFMMHEYVNYYTNGEPVANLKRKYKNAVLGCVQGWLETLRPYILESEILNYIISLYYDRSMVSMASFIAYNFRKFAYCPGASEGNFEFKDDLVITDKAQSRQVKLKEINNNKLIAFVSDGCPVSMVETVMVARHTSQENGPTIIVVPLEKLNEHHLSMGRMISGRNILYVDDERWRKENQPKKLALPRFVQIEEVQTVEVAK